MSRPFRLPWTLASLYLLGLALVFFLALLQDALSVPQSSLLFFFAVVLPAVPWAAVIPCHGSGILCIPTGFPLMAAHAGNAVILLLIGLIMKGLRRGARRVRAEWLGEDLESE